MIIVDMKVMSSGEGCSNLMMFRQGETAKAVRGKIDDNVVNIFYWRLIRLEEAKRPLRNQSANATEYDESGAASHASAGHLYGQLQQLDSSKVVPDVTAYPSASSAVSFLTKRPGEFPPRCRTGGLLTGQHGPGRIFCYCDAQYHRIGVSLHQTPVNCPFTAKFYYPLNFDGPMRVDAIHGGNKQHVPNSFAHKFRTDAVKVPYVVGNIISRMSHF
ncbi:uncharacterized protein J7T54_001512 [Emericellopsis cladophorae]|uniref:Catalase core domain-containing protein n=1 Tax=Emericellopsis cladophorae TaxID=2686198 RepID=A0A9P9XUL0_9HYPO|nr:uncharacterized protein J7T54_001512 [Emericellopsis cladophorae]KAI6778092.1 hypothetical protein J7T54_001512 [Emericellopsis cladophorae]